MTTKLNTILHLLRNQSKTYRNYFSAMPRFFINHPDNLTLCSEPTDFGSLIRHLALYSVNYYIPFVFTRVQLYSCTQSSYSICGHPSAPVFSGIPFVFTLVPCVFTRVPFAFTRIHLCSLVFTSVHSCSDSCGVLDQIVVEPDTILNLVVFRPHFSFTTTTTI